MTIEQLTGGSGPLIRSSKERRGLGLPRTVSVGAVLAVGILFVTSGIAGASSTSSAKLNAQLATMMGHPGFTAPGPAINVKSLPASTGIVVIDNAPGVAPLQTASAGAMAAATAAGFKPTLLNGGANNTPSDDINLLEQAVNLHPALVLQVGIITALEGSGLSYAQQHGVKVIGVDDNLATAGAPGEGSGPQMAGTASLNEKVEAQAMAKYVASNGPSNAQVGVILTNDIDPSVVQFAAFKTALKKLCPKCTITTSNVPVASWTTQITPTVTSMITANPNMKYLMPIVDGMTPWVTPALSGSNFKGRVITINGTPGAAMQALKSGVYRAQVGSAPASIGWYAMDAGFRALLKQPMQKNPGLPVTYFNTEEMVSKKLAPNSAQSLYGNAYVSGFKKLWGLK